MGRILVTGGAGYIGSHTVKALGENGYEVLIYDNLSTGKMSNLVHGDMIVGDLLDQQKLRDIFQLYSIDAVIHFAAKISVPESITFPLDYYKTNVIGTLNLLQVMREYHVNPFIFSSTAAIYDAACQQPITEDAKIGPISPYGHSKAIIEQVLTDLAAACDFRYVSLRYFNVAGADMNGKIGEKKENASHLISMCLKTALGKQKQLYVFGTDYPTKDGTCIRDYIHVDDLAQAHILALHHLLNNGKSEIFNCGYSNGFSVLEVINRVKKITKVDFPVVLTDRRSGDLPIVIADSSKIKEKLGWSPQFENLDTIIQSVWNWELKKLS